ncbi:MAG TPA: hypothetical protein VJH05_01950 [Candidatus Paceibacterota bacterium]
MSISKIRIFFVFLLVFLFLSQIGYAQTKTLKNIGFIQDNIWYSKDPFFEGDKIRIYTTVFNGSQYDFKGILEFWAGGKSIGKSNFSLISGAFQVLWADWVAEGGNKKIYASITEAKISLPGGAEEAIILENTKTGEIETFVDLDTDKDGIGNKTDTDDDNDKVSDVIEQKQGTDPLAKNAISNTVSVKTDMETEKTAIPEPKEIADSTKNIIAPINEFLDEQKEKVIAKKEELQKKLGEGESLFEFDFGDLLGKKETPTEVGVTESSEDDSVKNKNLLRLYILALSALIFSIEYKVIIYLFGIYIIYRILKFFVKKIFFRGG